jgi:hypothetical protein
LTVLEGRRREEGRKLKVLVQCSDDMKNSESVM